MTAQRWKLTVEYVGTDYCGWQTQEDLTQPTIQSTIEHALFQFCQQKIRLTVAGRTDSGVHALGQVAHLDLDYGDRPLSGYDFAKALNAHMRDSGIAILQAERVDQEFNARFGAVKKLYRYRILNRSAQPTFDARQIWHKKYPLDEHAMHKAAQILVGEHDFTSFRASECQAKSPIRTLDRLDVKRIGDIIEIEAEGRSFLHHQVRNMVGTLVLVGEGKWTNDDVQQALEAKKREAAGPTAAACGLTLVRVDYA